MTLILSMKQPTQTSQPQTLFKDVVGKGQIDYVISIIFSLNVAKCIHVAYYHIYGFLDLINLSLFQKRTTIFKK